jgi:hypothetical protein
MILGDEILLELMHSNKRWVLLLQSEIFLDVFFIDNLLLRSGHFQHEILLNVFFIYGIGKNDRGMHIYTSII